MKKLFFALLITCVTVSSGFARTNKVVRVRHRVNDNIVVQQKIVDVGDPVIVVGVPASDVGSEYYYRVQGDATTSLSDTDIEKIADRVVEKLVKILQAAPGDAPKPADPVTPTPPTLSPDDETKSLVTKVTTMLTQKCSACHSGDTIKGGIEIIKEGKLNDLPRDVKWDIYDAVYSGRMPKNQTALSDEDVAVIQAWARIKGK